MKHALIVLLILMSVEGAVAEDSVWRGKTVVVRDATPPAWKPYVEAMVAEFNAILPKRAPRLVYRAIDEAPCGGKARGIVICVADHFTQTGVAGEMQRLSRTHAEIRLLPLDRFIEPRIVLCHELMHALTGIPDNAALPYPDDSCVWGFLSHPGSFDVAYVQEVYRDHRAPPRRNRLWYRSSVPIKGDRGGSTCKFTYSLLFF
jgi:hypothetical protein